MIRTIGAARNMHKALHMLVPVCAYFVFASGESVAQEQLSVSNATETLVISESQLDQLESALAVQEVDLQILSQSALNIRSQTFQQTRTDMSELEFGREILLDYAHELAIVPVEEPSEETLSALAHWGGYDPDLAIPVNGVGGGGVAGTDCDTYIFNPDSNTWECVSENSNVIQIVEGD